MLPAERRQFILNELYKNKAVTVNDLDKVKYISQIQFHKK